MGVVNVLPVAKAAPPVEAAYQLIDWPLLGVAERLTVPVPHLVAGVVDTTLGLL